LINSETNSNRLCAETPETKVSLGSRGGIPYILHLLVSEFSPIKDGFVIHSVELVSNNC